MSRPTLLIIRTEAPSVTIARDELGDAFLLHEVRSVDTANRIVEALAPALILVDSQSADGDAIELCRALRHARRTAPLPIVVVCDSCSESDRIRGFQAGIDDYFYPPLSALETRERIQALLRRFRRSDRAAVQSYTSRSLVADFDGYTVSVDGIAIVLTRREFDLLRYLVENRNCVLTRQELLDGVWHGVEINDRRTVDTHIRKLRLKLGSAASQIQTLPGRGYRFDEGAMAILGELQLLQSVAY